MHVGAHEGSIGDLAAAWQELWSADPRATPFSSPGWGQAWWKHCAGDSRPWLLTVREHERLVGLAPLVTTWRGPFRVVRGLGEDVGDYWDVLAVPGSHAAVSAAVARELVARRKEWDVLALQRIAPGSSLAGELEGHVLRPRQRRVYRNPGIDLPGSFAEYLGSLPQARRTNLRRRLRHLDEGDVELREVTRQEELLSAFERWQELRIRQWDQLGKPLMAEHRTVRFRKFLVDAVRPLLATGHAAMWEFWRDGTMVGSFVAFLDERAFYQYLGGFDPAASRLGIGKIAIGHGIRSSIEAGRRYYDFLLGAESYKYWYGAIDRESVSLVLTSRRARSQAAGVAYRLARAAPG